MADRRTGRNGSAANLYLSEQARDDLLSINPGSMSEAATYAAKIVSKLDERTLQAAETIGGGDIAKGIKIAVKRFEGAK